MTVTKNKVGIILRSFSIHSSAAEDACGGANDYYWSQEEFGSLGVVVKCAFDQIVLGEAVERDIFDMLKNE